MICPKCGSPVAEGALACPSCGSELGVTQRLSLTEATWCPVCGALCAPGADACPKCGAPLRDASPAKRRKRDIDLPSIGDTGVMEALGPDAAHTGVMTRIESAIPPAAADAGAEAPVHDRIPRPRMFAFAALLAVLVVGGSALLITHPWDPDATRTSATTPADTSMQGFPGLVEELSGQEGRYGRTADEEGGSGTLAALTEEHALLAELSGRVDSSEADLSETGVSGDAAAREKGLSDLEALSIEVSNLISDIQASQIESSPYLETAKNLETLGNWLRNRCDLLKDAWELSVASSDPAADKDKILARAQGSSDYARLFAENYEAWAPTEVTE